MISWLSIFVVGKVGCHYQQLTTSRTRGQRTCWGYWFPMYCVLRFILRLNGWKTDHIAWLLVELPWCRKAKEVQNFKYPKQSPGWIRTYVPLVISERKIQKIEQKVTWSGIRTKKLQSTWLLSRKEKASSYTNHYTNPIPPARPPHWLCKRMGSDDI